MSLREQVAIAIYGAAFAPKDEAEAQRIVPSPGWCWVRTSEPMREFARCQADAALAIVTRQQNDDRALGCPSPAGAIPEPSNRTTTE